MFNLKLLAELGPRARRTHRLDLAAGFFFGLTVGVLETVPTLASRLWQADHVSLYILRASQSTALLFSVLWATSALGRRKMPRVFWPRVGAGCVLVGAAMTLSLEALVIALPLFYIMSFGALPLQNAVYNENYPDDRRNSLVSNTRAMSALGATLSGALAGIYLGAVPGDISLGSAGSDLPLEAILQRWRFVLVLTALALTIGAWIFSSFPLRSDKVLARKQRTGRGIDTPAAPSAPAMSWREKVREGASGFFHDRTFRRFMLGYFLFGFGAQMYRPVLDHLLGQDMRVDVVHIGLINSAIPMGLTFLTIAYWGRYLDRTDPVTGRILFNCMWMMPALSFVAATLLPTQWAIVGLYAGATAEGFSRAGSVLLWQLSAIYFAKTDRQVLTYTAVAMFMTGIRGFTAPAAGLYLLHLGLLPREVFLLVVAILLWSTWLLIKLRRDLGARAREGEPRTENQEPKGMLAAATS